MATTVSDLLSDIRIDVGQSGSLPTDNDLFSEEQIRRGINKALPFFNEDLGVNVSIVSDEFTPDFIDNRYRELLNNRSVIELCEMQATLCANNFDFKSDKEEADLAKKAENWLKRAKELRKQYKKDVISVNPDNESLIPHMKVSGEMRLYETGTVEKDDPINTT